MSAVKDFKINRTRIIFDDEFVREEYQDLILEHTVTVTKPALMYAGNTLPNEADTQTDEPSSPANTESTSPPSLSSRSVSN